MASLPPSRVRRHPLGDRTGRAAHDVAARPHHAVVGERRAARHRGLLRGAAALAGASPRSTPRRRCRVKVPSQFTLDNFTQGAHARAVVHPARATACCCPAGTARRHRRRRAARGVPAVPVPDAGQQAVPVQHPVRDRPADHRDDGARLRAVRVAQPDRLRSTAASSSSPRPACRWRSGWRRTSWTRCRSRSRRRPGPTARRCSRTLTRIVIPLMRPGIAVVFIFVFIQAWGNFFVPFVLLLSARTRCRPRSASSTSSGRTARSPTASSPRSRSSTRCPSSRSTCSCPAASAAATPSPAASRADARHRATSLGTANATRTAQATATMLVEARIDRFVRDRVDPGRPPPRRAGSPSRRGRCRASRCRSPRPSRQTYTPVRGRLAVGRPPWGTTWFHVTGTVPADFGTAAGHRRRARSSTSASPSGSPGSRPRASSWRPDGTTIKAHRAAQRRRAADGRRRGSRSTLYVEAACEPGHRRRLRSRARRRSATRATAGDDPIYALAALDVVERDDTVWELQQDIWSCVGLMAELPDRRHAAAHEHPARARAVPSTSVDPDDVAGTAAAAAPRCAAVLAVARRRRSAHRVDRRRPRAHRLRLALAGARDEAQVRPHLLERARPDGPRPRLRRSRARPRSSTRGCKDELPARSSTRIKQRVAEGRFDPGRRHVGRVRHEHARRRGAGPPVRRRQAVLPRGVRRRHPRGVAARLVRLHGRAAADRPRRRARSGSSRRSRRGTRRTACRTTRSSGRASTAPGSSRTSRRSTPTTPTCLARRPAHAASASYKEQRRREHLDLPFGCGDGGGGPTREMIAAAHRHARPRGLAARGARHARRSSSSEPSRAPDARRCGPARCTSSSTAAPTRRRSARSRATAAPSTCCARPSCGRRRRPCGSARLPVRRARARSGTPCCCSSSTTSCPGSSIAWVHRTPRRTTPAVARGARGDCIGDGASAALAGQSATARRRRSTPAPRPTAVGGVHALVGRARRRRPVARGRPRGRRRSRPCLAADGDGFVFDNGAGRGDHRRARPRRRRSSTPSPAATRSRPARGRRWCSVFRDTPNQWDAWDIDARLPAQRARRPVERRLASSVEGGRARRAHASFGSSTVTTRYSARRRASRSCASRPRSTGTSSRSC